MSEINKQVVLKFIAAMSANEPEVAAECLAPDCVTTTMGFSLFAGSRPAEQVIGAIESFKMLFPQGLGLKILSVTADGERVVVEAKGHSVTGDGKPYENDYCFVATVRDGLMVKLNEYLCSAYAEKVLGPLVQQTGSLGVETA